MKAIIYLRTSTKEQFPEKQKKQCLEFAKQRGYEVIDVLEEHLSGYKDIRRPKYEEVKSRAFKGEINAVIVWALDRWVRNRDTLLDDVSTLRNYNVKLHSVNEQWLEAINLEGSLGKTIQEFLLGLLGSIAQMESQRKSERIKMAYNNKKGRWGRKDLSLITQNKIIEAHKLGKTFREITKEVYYYDKHNHPKFVSLGFVHKTLNNVPKEKDKLEGVS